MGVIDNLKEIAHLVKKFNDAELNQKIDAFEREIVELTLQIGSLEEENARASLRACESDGRTEIWLPPV